MSEQASIVAQVVALWDREDGWIPGSAYRELAAALGIHPDRLLEARQKRSTTVREEIETT